MTLCFFNNINCCYYPAHTSHGLQPLDNGPYNALKSAYRKNLSQLAYLTDSAPVDKINFIRCYAKARQEAFTKKNIESGFRVTGNWPISRRKALIYPEIKPDREDREVRPRTPDISTGDEDPLGLSGALPVTPTSSRQIKDLGKYEVPVIRRKFQKAACAYDNKVMEGILKDERIRQLEAQLERLQPKRRRKIPNPNRTFMTLGECLASGLDPTAEDIQEVIQQENEVVADGPEDDEEELEDPEEDLEGDLPEPVRTRSGRAVQRPNNNYWMRY